jgi:hypothetical protein
MQLTQDELELKHTLELDFAGEIATLDVTVAEKDLLEEHLVALAKQLRSIPVRQAIQDGLKMSPRGARRFWTAYLSPAGTSNAEVLAILKGRKP